jgi:hypothetical protein
VRAAIASHISKDSLHSAGVPQSSLTVMTMEEKEKAERWFKISADPPLRVPRHPDSPYSALYPHVWHNLLKNGTPADQVYSMWTSEMSIFLPPSRILHQSLGRYRTGVDAVKSWFHAVPPDLSYHMARLFLDLIFNLVEIFLLCQIQPLNASLKTATLKFWAVIAQQQHSSNGLDLLSAITAAREVKDEKNHRVP